MSVGAVVDDLDTETVAESPPDTGSGLGDLIRGKVKKPRRTMLYGVQGVGKSTWAASAPDAVFIPTEEGLNDIDCDKFPVAKSFKEFEDRLIQLAKADHTYRTVAIDSLDWLEQLVWQKVCQEKGVKSIADIGYGKGYIAALSKWRTLTEGLDALRTNGMGCVLIGHVAVRIFSDPLSDSYDVYELDLHKKAAALLQRWADAVLFLNNKVTVKKEEVKGKDRKRGIGDDDRKMYTQKRPAHPGGGRGVFGQLPYELELSYEAWINAINEAKGE
jgi:hypothetical protein